MSPPIISRSTTPTQSRFSTARDHFSPGVSRPNPMSPRAIDLETTVEDWVDGLSSPLSTPSERISVLNQIEKTLVKITTSPGTSVLPGLDQSTSFWTLQTTAGFSLAEVLLAHVYRLHLDLERLNEAYGVQEVSQSSRVRDSETSRVQGLGLDLPPSEYTSSGKRSITDVQRQRIHSAVSEICIAITILQGLTLCSKSSKRITCRKSSLELLLAIVLSDYCTKLLPPILFPSTPATSTLTPTSPGFPLPQSPSTPTTSGSSRKSETDDAPLSLPSGFALDLLMCVLVDNEVAQERFSDMGGIHQIVQLSHKCADTVTTPASTPTSANSPTWIEAATRSSYVTALKQTDLLCLEFRYFWSQMLQGDANESRRASLEGVDEGPTTPKASPRKRASRSNLGRQQEEKDTPKPPGRRVGAPIKARATSEEAPCSRTSIASSTAAAPASPSVAASGGEGSPRKLRHSRSVAELRKKPSLSGTASSTRTSTPPPPVPTLPSTLHITDSPASIETKPPASSSSSSPSSASSSRHRGAPLVRPSTSSGPSREESRQSSGGGRGDRARRSTVSIQQQQQPRGSEEAGQRFNPLRPGMSSRDRPRIPSPLKPRTAAQEASDFEAQRSLATSHHLQQQQQQQGAIPYRRLRSSTTSTPFEREGRSREVVAVERPRMGDVDVDVDENRNPFAANVDGGQREKERAVRQKMSPTDGSTHPPSHENKHMISNAESRSSLLSVSISGKGYGNANGNGSGSGIGIGTRIPPSPAVRRAQIARARSLSPTKLALPPITNNSSAISGIDF